MSRSLHAGKGQKEGMFLEQGNRERKSTPVQGVMSSHSGMRPRCLKIVEEKEEDIARGLVWGQRAKAELVMLKAWDFFNRHGEIICLHFKAMHLSNLI